MDDIHTIATGIFLGGVLVSMFLVSFRRMVYAGDDETRIPWWAYVGFIAPLLYMLGTFYTAT